MAPLRSVFFSSPKDFPPKQNSVWPENAGKLLLPVLGRSVLSSRPRVHPTHLPWLPSSSSCKELQTLRKRKKKTKPMAAEVPGRRAGSTGLGDNPVGLSLAGSSPPCPTEVSHPVLPVWDFVGDHLGLKAPSSNVCPSAHQQAISGKDSGRSFRRRVNLQPVNSILKWWEFNFTAIILYSFSSSYLPLGSNISIRKKKN